MAVRSKFYQIFSVVVPMAGATVKITGNFNVLYERVTGVFLTVSNSTATQNSKFTKFQIDNDDVFPENFEVIILTCGNEVPPDDKFMSFDERGKLSPFDMTYIDGSALGCTYPYNLNLYFRLENKPHVKAKSLKEFMKGLQENFKQLEGFLLKGEEEEKE